MRTTFPKKMDIISAWILCVGLSQKNFGLDFFIYIYRIISQKHNNMKKLIFSFLLIITSTDLFCQIEYNQNFWGSRYYQGDKKLKSKEAESILKQVPTAHQSYLKGKTNNMLSLTAATGGLVLSMYQLQKTLTDEDVSVGMTLGGIGLLGLSYYFNQAATSKFHEAASRYNQKGKIGIAPALSQNGLGVSIRF